MDESRRRLVKSREALAASRKILNNLAFLRIILVAMAAALPRQQKATSSTQPRRVP
jgi:hypothetical protein